MQAYFRVFQISTGTSNFLSGGLASFLFWSFAIPADNVKK
jgi:solute carrier family 25 carnitine/acylcarnitine transporter 20/29